MASLATTTCCGLGEISDVGWSDRRSILAAVDSARTRRMGAVFATTTDDQEEAVELLKGCGFRVIRRFVNPNTGNRITMWMRSTRRRRLLKADRA